MFGAPIYVRHEVVHNRRVVEELRDKGAVFVEELDEIPDDATVIFSAHGVSQAVADEAERRGLHVFDATCPLVTKVHMEVNRYARKGFDVILIGHDGHPEVEGTMGRFDPSHGGQIQLVEDIADAEAVEVRDPEQVGVVTQTTLSIDDTAAIAATLRRRFPAMATPKKEDICYATTNRQEAVKDLANQVDLMIVVGAANSSNSNRLKEMAEKLGTPARRINDVRELERDWLNGVQTVGVTSGASAPESLVQEVVAELEAAGGRRRERGTGVQENVVFHLPKTLRIQPA
ncbi:MAG: 4-hydroxy-3-methylbut-2-enyl diphosphate reductase [Proteobacteria bacterium SW_6_67_9]|nr:MAG: 4-hydroxy-3-methylbut-2-enyl diphosphate reductase [Proteobacteria bacterium SW_6_67_9]